MATNTCPRGVAEVKPLRDGCPKAREMGSGGSGSHSSQGGALRTQRLQPKKDQQYHLTESEHKSSPCHSCSWLTWKQGLQRGILFYSVTMYSILCKSHGLGPTSATTAILQKENSMNFLV